MNLWLCPTSSDQALPTPKPFATATYTMKDGDAPQSFDPANAYVDNAQLDLATACRRPYEFSYGSKREHGDQRLLRA